MTTRRFIILLSITVALCSPAHAQPLQPIPRTERIPGTETRRILPATHPTPPPFIIGVWYPPLASMSLWKTRGVNTAVGYEHQSNTVTLDEWSNAANGEGLFTIRSPHPDLATDVKDPYLLALMHIDEPDLKGIEPSGLSVRYADWKKAAPELPVFLSVSGGGVLFQKTPRVTYREYFTSADWIANDFYPVTGWNQPTWIPRLGEAVDTCRTLSKGKPQFAFIETSSQQLEWLPKTSRGVTPDEFRAEIWHAIIHGVKGIIYFPQQFNPFQYDATPSNISLEMAKQNRLLADLGSVLALPSNPKDIKVIVKPPLEAAWRQSPDGTVHLIILNLSLQTLSHQTIHWSGIDADNALLIWEEKSLVTVNNEVADDYFPYQVRLYKLKPQSQPSKCEHR